MTREQALEGNSFLICKVKNHEEDKYIHMSAREKNIRACMRVCKNCEWDLHKEIDERCEYYKMSEDRKEYVEMTNEEVKEYYFAEMVIDDDYSEKGKEIFLSEYFSNIGDSEKRKDFYERLKNKIKMLERAMKIASIDKRVTFYKNLDELITIVYSRVIAENTSQQGEALETSLPFTENTVKQQIIINGGDFRGANFGEVQGDMTNDFAKIDLDELNKLVDLVIQSAQSQNLKEKDEILCKIEELRNEMKSTKPDKEKIYTIVDWTHKITAISVAAINLRNFISQFF